MESSQLRPTKIYLQTGYLLDNSFDRVLSNQSTIAKLLPEMQEAWDTRGPRLLEAAINEIGKEFRLKELLCYLIMHPTMFSCSHPFLININKYLNFDRRVDEHAMKFAEQVFHEALHIYLDDNFSDLLNEDSEAASPLTRKYKDNGPHVTAHTHLYAIQKHIFAKCNMTLMWDMVCEGVKQAHNDGYKIAVDIINNVGSEPFLDELR